MWNLFNPYKDRDETLRRLGYQSYRSYLRSPLWRAIRARVLLPTATGPRLCWRCNRPATEVHHRAYDLATLLGQHLGSLTPVCHQHHREAGQAKRGLRPYDQFVRANATIYQHGHEANHASRRKIRDARQHAQHRAASLPQTPARPPAVPVRAPRLVPSAGKNGA
ncbi:MAG: hypothetical protein OEW98_00150 [Betaproteobacteria bacterium]|nr:hypothetical protein [Betaproteobacteria bacterium]